VSFYHISPCALFYRELLPQYTVRSTFAVCCWYIRREPLFCRGLESLAHGISLNAVRRPTANGPHTEKADFPVVGSSTYGISDNKERISPVNQTKQIFD
jgi:hypothetical protein